MPTLDDDLESVLARRKKVKENIERLRGRQEQAQTNVAQIEQECRSKNVDPERIDEILQQLETKYKTLIEELDKDTQAAERALEPFVGGTNT